MAKVARQSPRPTPRASSPKKQTPGGSPTPRPGSRSAPVRRQESSDDLQGYLGVTPLAMVLHGPSGVGKTEFAAHFPGAAFIYDPQEPGCVDLLKFNKIPEPLFMEMATDWKDTMGLLQKVADGYLKCETLVLDSLTGFEKLCFVHHCHENFNDDYSKEGFFSFQQGPSQASKTDWSDLIDLLDAVRRRNVSTIAIAHTQVKQYNNPEGPDYDRFIPYMQKDTWAAVHRWAQAIIFYKFQVNASKDRGATRTKAKDAERQLVTDWTPTADAKNRYGLEQYIDAGMSGKEAYENFEKAFREACSKAGTVCH